MARPAKEPEDRLIQLALRIKPSGHEWIEQTAAKHNLTISEMARQMLARAAEDYMRRGWRP